MDEHYTLVRRLGYGGQGEVWLAKPRAGRTPSPLTLPAATADGPAAEPQFVALKLLPRGLSKYQVEAVAQEVQCLLELGEGHVNVIKPSELLLSRTHLALVTDYAPGGSLADYLRRRGTLPEKEASYFFRQIVEALLFCHQRGIGARPGGFAPRGARCGCLELTRVAMSRLAAVYRDVKPENTLLSGSNPPTVALCDFGVARRFDGRGRLTTLAGTPGYFAPQVLGCMFVHTRSDTSGGYDGAKADVWSAGALLSELILRRLPYDFSAFEADLAPAGTLRHLWERARSTTWREAAAAVGRPLEGHSVTEDALNLLEGMLHPRERERFSMDDVAKHAWTRQPLGPAHEAALATLATQQQELRRMRRMSGVYCRADGDGIIAALVSRASAGAPPPGVDEDDGAPDCIRLRLEDVPRMQCPPSLAGVPSSLGPSGVAPSPRRGFAPRAPPSPQGFSARARSLAVAAVDDDDFGDGGSIKRGQAHRPHRLLREELTV